MKWNEIVAITAAVVIGIFFVIYPLFSILLTASGISPDTEPLFSAYSDGENDLSSFIEDVEKLNYNTKGSLYYAGSEDNDGVNDYEVRAIVSSPVLLLGDMVDPEKTLYIAVGIEKGYSPDEVNAINRFLQRGGHAIIADDFGEANYLSKDYGVTFYGGQFYDENFDKNANYTIVQSAMGSDIYDRNGFKVWEKAKPYGDGIFDDDQDGDGKFDEDDDIGSSKNFDDDRDNAKLIKDLRNNDPWQNDNPDEPDEGFDEDPMDDDKMYNVRFGGDADVLWEGQTNIDLEFLDGKSNDDDNGDGAIDNNGDIIDEDVMKYDIITHRPTGLSSAVNPWIWCAGSSKSFIDMNGDQRLSIPEGNLKDMNADEVSSSGNEIQFCVEVPVADDGSGAVDIVTGEARNTIKGSDSSEKYKVGELNQNEKLLTQLGSVAFISDPSIFMNDLYNLNHIRYDVNLPFDPRGDGLDNDLDGLIDEDKEILTETGDVSEEDLLDPDRLADKSPDFWSEAEIDDYSWLSDDLRGKPKLDYDNQQFLLDLVRHLCPAKEGVTNLVLIDESRHRDNGHFVKPVYRSMEITAYLTSNPFYSYPIVISIGIILLFVTLLIKDKESWVHIFDISSLYPRKMVPKDPKLQTTKLKLALREKVRMIKGLSPEEFSSLNEVTVMSSIRDPDLIELMQSEERLYSQQEIKRMIEKIKKIQSM
jgi:hypothetical protein